MYLKKSISIHKNLINIIKIKPSNIRINKFNAGNIKSVQEWCWNYHFRKNDVKIIILVRMIPIYHFARIIILVRMISELSFLQEQYQNYHYHKNDIKTIILAKMMTKLSYDSDISFLQK